MRLIQRIRDDILRDLIQRRIGKDQNVLTAAEHAFGMQIYKDRWNAHERATMDALPDGWLPTVRSLRAKLEDDRDVYDFPLGEIGMHTSFVCGFLSDPCCRQQASSHASLGEVERTASGVERAESKDHTRSNCDPRECREQQEAP